MTREECRFYNIVPALIISAYTLILYTSTTLLNRVMYIPGLIPYAIPISVALIAPALVTIRDTIAALGGAKKYFCSGFKMLKSLRHHGGRCEGSKEIITTGPFAYTRHPVYTSTLLITIALTLVYPGFALALPLIALWVYAASIVEEWELSRLSGYVEYRMRVPRMSILGVIKYGYKRILSRQAG